MSETNWWLRIMQKLLNDVCTYCTYPVSTVQYIGQRPTSTVDTTYTVRTVLYQQKVFALKVAIVTDGCPRLTGGVEDEDFEREECIESIASISIRRLQSEVGLGCRESVSPSRS
jgi:hypothetical protein